MDTLFERYIELEKLEEEIQDKKEAVAYLWLENNCPFKVGDDILIVCGHAHEGKMGVVKRVSTYIKRNYRDDTRSFNWTISGNVLRKNGEESLMRFNFSQEQYERYLSESKKEEIKKNSGV